MRKLIFFSVTKVTDSLARFWNLTSMFILEFNTLKIKLSWWLRKCVRVLCYNKLFLITATKGKQVAVPTKMRTFRSVSFNSSHHDGYKCSFPYLACQPIAIKWSFVFTFISLKRFAVQRKELTTIRLPTKLWTDKFNLLLKSLFGALCQISPSILKWK